MHESGEHDTLDDQIAYEQEHGTREYQWARDLYDLLLRGDTFTTAGLWRAEQLAHDLMQSLAPRPAPIPTGSIEDVSFTETDQ